MRQRTRQRWVVIWGLMSRRRLGALGECVILAAEALEHCHEAGFRLKQIRQGDPLVLPYDDVAFSIGARDFQLLHDMPMPSTIGLSNNPLGYGTRNNSLSKYLIGMFES